MPVDVLVPPLGTNVDTLKLISWFKQEGESVTKDEPLFLVETDKATLEVESPATGILCRVSAAPGAEVVALSRIATIRGTDEPISPDSPIPINGERPNAHSISPLSLSDASMPAPVSTLSAQLLMDQHSDRVFISPRAKRLAESSQLDWNGLIGTGPEGAIIERDVLEYQAGTRLIADSPAWNDPAATARAKAASPVARRMAEEAGVDWTQLSGSGPGGKVVREDVEQAVSAVDATGATLRSGGHEADRILEVLPLSGVRGIIADRMMQSGASTAPVTLTAEADATALVELRRQLAEDGLKVSYNALFMKITARALRDHPRVNASLEGDTIKVWREVNIGLAVDAEDGLRVPVVRNLDGKGLKEIEQEIRALAEAAREGRALPQQMQGGTFTLTNLGMYGIDAFTPVINLPECAILGVGRIKPQPALRDDKLVTRQMAWLSLTFDHRLLDGGPAARFLQRITQLVEKPHLLLG